MITATLTLGYCHDCGRLALLYAVQTMAAVRWLQPGKCEPAEGVMLCAYCRDEREAG